jgi:hypothetical protein
MARCFLKMFWLKDGCQGDCSGIGGDPEPLNDDVQLSFCSTFSHLTSVAVLAELGKPWSSSVPLRWVDFLGGWKEGPDWNLGTGGGSHPFLTPQVSQWSSGHHPPSTPTTAVFVSPAPFQTELWGPSHRAAVHRSRWYLCHLPGRVSGACDSPVSGEQEMPSWGTEAALGKVCLMTKPWGSGVDQKGVIQTRVQISVLPPTGWVTLGKLLNLSEPQYHWQNAEIPNSVGRSIKIAWVWIPLLFVYVFQGLNAGSLAHAKCT